MLVGLPELAEDFELYAGNFLKIVDRDSATVPFVLNRGQRKLHAALERQRSHNLPQRAVLLKSRQFGGSTYCQARSFHMGHLTHDRNALTLAHNAESAEILFQKQQTFWDNLPEEGPLAVTKKRFTRRLIQFNTTNSRLQVVVVGEAARGFTAHGLHLSEVAQYDNIKNTLLAVKQAVPRRRDTFVVLESTPYGFNEFRTVYLRAKAGKSSYAAVFVAWFEDEESERVLADFDERDLDEDERLLVLKYGVTLNQLAYRRLRISDECDGDKERFLQEYPSDDMSCFLTSGRPVFSSGLEFQLAAVPPEVPDETLPPRCEITLDTDSGKPKIIAVPNGRLRIYKDFDPNDRHVFGAGVDPSEGDPGSDHSPIAVLDRTTLQLAAHWYGRAAPDVLADIAVLLCRYYGDAKLIWEANNHGILFKYRVEELEYFNVYYRQVSEESVAREETDKAGYMSSEKARATLFDTLAKYVRDAAAAGDPLRQVRDPIMVSQMTTLVYENEKAQALEGFEKDSLVAFALALFDHRGNADAPLVPLSADKLRAAHETVGWRFSVGQRPSKIELEPFNVTCEELEAYDEQRFQKQRRRDRIGLGKML